MCGRYYIADDETNAEIRKICNEINLKYQNASLGVPNVSPGAPNASLGVSNVSPGVPNVSPCVPSIRQRRCIVPSNGFFEWDHREGHTKSKFLLKRQESPVLYMAGLYSSFEDRLGQKFAAFVILTVDANASLLAPCLTELMAIKE